MSKPEKIFFVLVFALGTFYLVLPSPKSFHYLPDSLKSIEPGDTTQIANVSAYYTDLPRKEVLNFYTDYFSRSPFLSFPLITYRLNHPPERIREVLRETQQSTYVEEIIHPLRESVFISGFEWNNDPFTPSQRRIKNILTIDGKTYQFKVTLFYQESKLWQRLLVFYLSLIAIYLILVAYEGLWQKWKKTN
jgi:hypothetical protein